MCVKWVIKGDPQIRNAWLGQHARYFIIKVLNKLQLAVPYLFVHTIDSEVMVYLKYH